MNYSNRKFNIVFIILFCLSLSLFAQERVHVVVSGDTIFSIARSFNVSRDDLIRVNGITDPNRLRVGQRLRIPDNSTASAGTSAAASVTAQGSTAAAGNSSEVRYRVVRGDTFYGIARRFGVTVNEILTANSLSANHVLRQDEWLVIPVNRVSAAPAVTVPVPATPASLPAARTDARASDPAAVDSSIRWPITAREMSSMAGNSNGVIITGERSEPVRSLTAGTVIFAGPHRGYGRVVIIQATNGYRYVYGGCETLAVKEGDRVGPGMEMGKLGVDPITQRPQLFFWVYNQNSPVDPARAPRA